MLSKRGFLTKRNKKVLIAIIVVFLICLITLLTDNRKNMFFAFKLFHKDEFLRSFHAPTTKQPRDGRNIFFLETSGIFKLNARQACAIESAGNVASLILFYHKLNSLMK